MQVTFSYPSGPRLVADVLAVGADSIRLVAPGRAEGFGLYLEDEDWVTEAGSVVRMDSIYLGDKVSRLQS